MVNLFYFFYVTLFTDHGEFISETSFYSYGHYEFIFETSFNFAWNTAVVKINFKDDKTVFFLPLKHFIL